MAVGCSGHAWWGARPAGGQRGSGGGGTASPAPAARGRGVRGLLSLSLCLSPPPTSRPPGDKAALGRVRAGRQQKGTGGVGTPGWLSPRLSQEEGPATRPRDPPPRVASGCGAWCLAGAHAPEAKLELGGREGVSRGAAHCSVGRMFWKGGSSLGLLTLPPFYRLLFPRCWETRTCVGIAALSVPGPSLAPPALEARGCHCPSQPRRWRASEGCSVAWPSRTHVVFTYLFLVAAG